MQPVFSIKEALTFGWTKTKEHSRLIFQVMLVMFAFQIISSIIQKGTEHSSSGGIANLLLVIVSIVLGTGLTVITLKIAKGEQAVFKDIVPPAGVVWNVFLVSLLSGILEVVGFILLIIPGVYFGLRFSMVRYAVLDGTSVMGSFEKSTTLTHGIKWQLLQFFLVLVLINIVGAILLLVGLLVTIPVTMIAYGHVYVALTKRVSSVTVAEAPAQQ